MIRVLYVDDEPALLDLTRLFLERDGEFGVDPAVSAEEALCLLRDHHYDAIVSDYQMPGMNDRIFAARQAVRETPFPSSSSPGRGREEIVIEAINSGADSYLQKGGNPRAQFAELALKIQQIVRRSCAERALRETSRYRAIFQNASDIIRVLDGTGGSSTDFPLIVKISGTPTGR